MTLLSFAQAATPPFIINVTGPETLSTREVAEAMGRPTGNEANLLWNRIGNGVSREHDPQPAVVRPAASERHTIDGMGGGLDKTRRRKPAQTDAF